MNDSNTNGVNDITALIRSWEDEHEPVSYDPIPTLTKMAEIIEMETENYLKMDPDPFDERHPSRTDPDCKLGQILKIVFRKDNFMSKLLNDYMRDTYYSRNNITDRDITQLNIAASRLLLDLMPGLETSVVFQDMDSLIQRLIKWATASVEPLQSYATGVLAAAMDVQEIAAKFRDENGQLVPLLLRRLVDLKDASGFGGPISNGIAMLSPPQTTSRPFARFSTSRSNGTKDIDEDMDISYKRKLSSDSSPSKSARKRLRVSSQHTTPQSTNHTPLKDEASSNSSWAELESFVIGNVSASMYPPTLAARQIFILRFLQPIGEYQEFLSHALHGNIALDLILTYVDVRRTKEARLAFEALKYLAALLCHKKFSIEFLQKNGLEALLNVPRPSIAATGVSICLYYLGYCEEAMERVCLMEGSQVKRLVRYALWLMECSHDSGKCQAIMFFGLMFQFKIILDEFDVQDGLRKMHNVIATLPILQPDHAPLNEDQECASRQIVRHVCVAYRRYMEAHLYHKAELIKRSQVSLPPYKACDQSPEEIQQNIDLVLEHAHPPHPPLKWPPIDRLLKLGAVPQLLKIIALAYEWNYGGRAETVRSALDVLAIACVSPKILMILCEKIDLPEERLTVGFSIVVGAAEGEIVRDSEVQKAALRVIVNSVCAKTMTPPTIPPSTITASTTTTPKLKSVYSGLFKTKEESLMQKVWDCVRSNSGIMVLIQLLNCKVPITDADEIRTLACKGLTGLARCDTVKQILSKLSLFVNGELQLLMRDPILQEKRQQHVTFQRYALELLEILSGGGRGQVTPVNSVTNDVLSLANLNRIHKANVVAQTKIHFNDYQLLQLIYRHLAGRGLVTAAECLAQEAGLEIEEGGAYVAQPAKFRFDWARSGGAIEGVPSLMYSTPLSARTKKTADVPPSPGAIRLMIKKNSAARSCGDNDHPSASTPSNQKRLYETPTTPLLRKKDTLQTTPSLRLLFPSDSASKSKKEPPRIVATPRPAPEPIKITLDSIITEYLTNQHALCENPMATCPPFDLFRPHKCPDPKPRLTMRGVNNFVVRCARRHLGYFAKSMDRRFVHSRFCPVQSIRAVSASEDGFFTCARFLPENVSIDAMGGDVCRNAIIVGDYNGDVRLFNKFNGNEVRSFSAHDNYIVNMEVSRSGEFLLTSSTWGRPISAMWTLSTFDRKWQFNDEDHVEFSKLTQDKIIGTKAEVATIYDVNTGTAIMKLAPQMSNLYTKNKATFSWDDELVLTDGVLYDVKSGKVINRLDKLNQSQNGVFHPNGLQIVSNTEVWDIRTDTKTSRLLKTVPVLNRCSVVFSPDHSTIYAIAMEQEMDDGDSAFDSSFKTIDAADYSSIATIEVKKSIYDLAVDRYDTQIALVENQGIYNSVQESVVRLYDVGRRRDDEDEQNEEEDDDDDMDNDNSDDDASDRVIINLGADDDDDDNDNGNSRGRDNDEESEDDDGESWTSFSSTDTSDAASNDLLFDY